jgi:hypothetical protein
VASSQRPADRWKRVGVPQRCSIPRAGESSEDARSRRCRSDAATRSRSAAVDEFGPPRLLPVLREPRGHPVDLDVLKRHDSLRERPHLRILAVPQFNLRHAGRPLVMREYLRGEIDVDVKVAEYLFPNSTHQSPPDTRVVRNLTYDDFRRLPR